MIQWTSSCCGKSLAAEDAWSGKPAHCPHCQSVLTIPALMDATLVQPVNPFEGMHEQAIQHRLREIEEQSRKDDQLFGNDPTLPPIV